MTKATPFNMNDSCFDFVRKLYTNGQATGKVKTLSEMCKYNTRWTDADFNLKERFTFKNTFSEIVVTGNTVQNSPIFQVVVEYPQRFSYGFRDFFSDVLTYVSVEYNYYLRWYSSPKINDAQYEDVLVVIDNIATSQVAQSYVLSSPISGRLLGLFTWQMV
jgi:hypothetical protein